MPNVSNFGTQTDNAVVQGTVTDRAMVIPDLPPQGLMSVGPRVTPHFVKPSLWSALTTYHFFDAVHDAAGASYVAIKPEVPAGTELTDEGYWFLWADPNSQFADLSELVKTFNGRIAQNTADIATKAPNNHASEDTTYGVGNEANYGHVRLATDNTPATSDANAGIAATPKMVKNSVDNQKSGTVVIIGDSWSYAGTDWIKGGVIGNRLMELMNASDAECVAVSGAGYTGGTVNVSFESEIDNITTAESNIKCIFVIGGINDAEKSGITQAVKNFCTKISTKYKKIPTFYVTSNAPKEMSSRYIETTKEISNAITNGVVIKAPYLIDRTNSLWTDDGIHPNTTGLRQFAQNIFGAMNGGCQNTLYINTLIDGLKVSAYIDKATSRLIVKTNATQAINLTSQQTNVCLLPPKILGESQVCVSSITLNSEMNNLATLQYLPNGAIVIQLLKNQPTTFTPNQLNMLQTNYPLIK
jgi:lysophospholipase L1-like esterase